MGIWSYFFGVPSYHHSKVGSGPRKGKDISKMCAEVQTLSSIRLVVSICRLFGVCPCKIVCESGTLRLKYDTRGWLVYSLIVFVVTTCYMTFQLASLCNTMNKLPVLRLMAQSLWFICGVPTYLLSVFMFVRGKKLVQLFDDWCDIEIDLERLFCPVKTRKNIIFFEVMYLVLSLVSIILCGFHALNRPNLPIYPFYYLSPDSHNEVHHIAYAVFQMAMIGWIWAGLVVLEGTCCLFSTVVVQCMKTLCTGLDYMFKIQGTEEDSYNVAEVEVDTHQKFMQTAVYSILHKNNPPSKLKHPETHEEHGANGSAYKAQPFNDSSTTTLAKDDYTIFVVKKMQTVDLLQRKVNEIMGPLLLIDTAQLVFLCCTLLYLPVRFAHKLEDDAAIIFFGNWITVLFRLIIFLVSLGGVYSAGQEVNVTLAKAMSSVKMKLECQNSVLAHLSVYSSNPITFTAWDFFPITKGTLLAAFSLISTYAILFFQINF